MFGIDRRIPWCRLIATTQRFSICLMLVVVTTSCTKNITMKDAYVFESLKGGEETIEAGPNFQVNIVISRKMVRRIYQNELYIHIRLVSCDIEEVRATAEAFLDGKRMNRFEDLRSKLQQSPEEFFTVTGIISERLDWQSTCVTLTGGSYMLGKVRSDRVRLRWRVNDTRNLANGI